jgi:hypothetical protein
VIMRMWVLCWANVVHLVGRAALRAAGNRLLTGKLPAVSHCLSVVQVEESYGNPKDVVRISWAAGAANILLIARRVDGDGVFQGAYNPSAAAPIHLVPTLPMHWNAQ